MKPRRHHVDTVFGRLFLLWPGVPPGVFFRMLFAGSFEGLESHSLISWRFSDSRSIVQKDSGKGWKDYTKKLAKKAGLDDPTDDELRQFDRTRTEKKVSNDDWENPNDPDAKITRVCATCLEPL